MNTSVSGKNQQNIDMVEADERLSEIYWCGTCQTPIINYDDDADKGFCPLCNSKTQYMVVDLRPVFPEERLLLEILLDKPLAFIEKTVWCCDHRYYIDGKPKPIGRSVFANADVEKIIKSLNEYSPQNSYDYFDEQVARFVKANNKRLNYLKDEAFNFVKQTVDKCSHNNIVISFSGGKDSTVTQDLVVRALSDPSIVHVYGDTTLEFPLTDEYVKRFKKDNPKAILKVAINREQNFFEVCEDIGPPARMMRWCCSMFKTGPITRVLTNLFRDKEILTFYGVRKCESVSRSKYNRVEDSADSVKIQKQTVASPIFLWKDVDIWLYMFGENVDFNDAYRLGYDRVGCWCCPNGNERTQFLSKIYMPEQWKKWHTFLVDFARRIGKPDAEVYVDTGKWKARQGGNGVKAAEDIKIKFTNCTAEDNAKVYQLTRPIDNTFYELFCPFGRVSKELGRKLIGEVIVLDIQTNTPILSIQPFNQDEYEYSVKVKTMNVKKHDDLQRMVGYQIRKYNACRKCLKCESLCKSGAISNRNDEYRVDDKRCTRCKMCITPKYLEGGCLMKKYLATKELVG